MNVLLLGFSNNIEWRKKTMSNTVNISSFTELKMLGTRFIAKRIRMEIEQALVPGDPIEIDFSGISVTQSFIDELLGPLALRTGPSLLERIAFKGCSDNVRTVVQFVLTSRLRDYQSSRSQSADKGDSLLEA